ncbi:Uncharacterised protein [Serratia rubidaea]|uniref:Uncharacterized protein n=1 Tax=Serratia rubidaea TaxID=61652 RepID=A0A3S5DFJ7_SERRU|nr:hypothetical protein D781_1929 [Serratia sp. FGI94]CAI0843268.1 Uncharacterised protein [Serratia rubidaea]CAI1649265.1 Uncharacterised protein [Serratia rubidaea]VEA73253.1 Uncharacterised protein [Serratia rubidaea]VEI71351.1 Uncharacterised protein [Serratia rubidaea]
MKEYDKDPDDTFSDLLQAVTLVVLVVAGLGIGLLSV